MADEDKARRAARLLLDARRSGIALAGLADAPSPATAAEAYAIQACVMAELGDIGGWKVGATGPGAVPTCAPLPAAGLHASPASLPAAAFAAPFVESEIAFRLGADLPARDRPYSDEAVRAAIASCHPAIEIVQSRFADPDAAGPLDHLADLIRHGAFIWGDPIEAWEDVDFPRLAVSQTIDGGAPLTGVGNPAGDMIRLVAWLANTGALWAGGLRAGQFITCGSWTGMTALGTGAEVVTQFAGAAAVMLQFR